MREYLHPDPDPDPAHAAYHADLCRAAHLVVILGIDPDGTPYIRASWAAELAEIAGRIRDREMRRARIVATKEN